MKTEPQGDINVDPDRYHAGHMFLGFFEHIFGVKILAAHVEADQKMQKDADILANNMKYTNRK